MVADHALRDPVTHNHGIGAHIVVTVVDTLLPVISAAADATETTGMEAMGDIADMDLALSFQSAFGSCLDGVLSRACDQRGACDQQTHI